MTDQGRIQFFLALLGACIIMSLWCEFFLKSQTIILKADQAPHMSRYRRLQVG